MQKLLFFLPNLSYYARGAWGCTAQGFLKNSGTYEEKTQAFIISINVTHYALIQNLAYIRSLRVNVKKIFNKCRRFVNKRGKNFQQKED